MWKPHLQQTLPNKAPPLGKKNTKYGQIQVTFKLIKQI